MRKDLRAGKVLVDWSQNDAHKTTVCVWSLRAMEEPTVSTPLHWEEVEEASRSRDGRSLAIDVRTAQRRIEREGDLFAPVLTTAQVLPPLTSFARDGAEHLERLARGSVPFRRRKASPGPKAPVGTPSRTRRRAGARRPRRRRVAKAQSR